MSASRPAGRETDRPESSWSVSDREKDSANGVWAPAWALVVPAVKVGEKPVAQAETMLNVSPGAAGGPDSGADQGVREVVVENAPQPSGVASGARGPPNRWSFRSEKGSCGVSANVVVSCPVVGSASTCPASLISTPSPSAVR